MARSGPIILGRWLATVVLIVYAALLFARLGAYVASNARGNEVDFFLFRDAAIQLRQHMPLYEPVRVRPGLRSTFYGALIGRTFTEGVFQHRNLNAPAFTLLLAPFAWLPGPAAFALWAALNLIAYALAVGLAWRELGLSGRAWYLPAVVALALAATGLRLALYYGQVGPILALPVVGVWIMARRSRWISAGLLLGALLALKIFLFPLLGLFLVRRRWTGLLATAVGGALLTALPLPFVGLVGYRDWLEILRGATNYTDPYNLSLVGTLYRIVALPSLTAWPLSLVVAAVGLCGLSWPPPASMRRIDRDAGLLIVVSVLGSPLGWVYYTVLFIPAVLGLAAAWGGLSPMRRACFVAALVLLWTPLPQFVLMFTAGSLLLAVAIGAPQGRGGRPRYAIRRPRLRTGG